MEEVLKRIGRGAEELAENEGHPQNDVSTLSRAL
jgi:hypothetical protein